MESGTKRAERVGLLGGTFNPVHTGHLIVAQTALEAFDLARVVFMPCAVPPHKRNAVLADADARLAMLRLAVEGDLRFDVSDLEIRRGGVSYAVDTVAELIRQQPGADLFFIIGSDTLPELHSWYKIYTLLALCTFVTLARPGFDMTALQAGKLGLDAPWPERLLAHTATGRLVQISSSDIRHRVAEGMSIRYLVPQAVEMYIAEHHLYGR